MRCFFFAQRIAIIRINCVCASLVDVSLVRMHIVSARAVCRSSSSSFAFHWSVSWYKWRILDVHSAGLCVCFFYLCLSCVRYTPHFWPVTQKMYGWKKSHTWLRVAAHREDLWTTSWIMRRVMGTKRKYTYFLVGLYIEKRLAQWSVSCFADGSNQYKKLFSLTN